MIDNTPLEVQVALNHVRSFFPSVSFVVFNLEGQWQYFTDDFESPSFEDVNIDTSILEQAVDAVPSFPEIYYFSDLFNQKNEEPEHRITACFKMTAQRMNNFIRDFHEKRPGAVLDLGIRPIIFMSETRDSVFETVEISGLAQEVMFMIGYIAEQGEDNLLYVKEVSSNTPCLVYKDVKYTRVY